MTDSFADVGRYFPVEAVQNAKRKGLCGSQHCGWEALRPAEAMAILRPAVIPDAVRWTVFWRASLSSPLAASGSNIGESSE
jgi:hypothetical protein